MNTKHACKKTSPRNPITPEPEPGPETPAFAGESDPIIQNLDETQQEIDQWSARIKGPLPDMMLNWLIPLYMEAIRQELKTVTDNTQRLKLLAQHSLTAVRLQRAADSSAKRQLERERVDLEKEKFRLVTAPAIEEKRPDYKRPLTDDERLAIIAKVDEIIGIQSDDLPEEFRRPSRLEEAQASPDSEPEEQDSAPTPSVSSEPPSTTISPISSTLGAPVSLPSRGSAPARPNFTPAATPPPATLAEHGASPKSRSSRREEAQTLPLPPEPSLSSPNPTDIAPASKNPSTQPSIHPAPSAADPHHEYEQCLFRMRTNQEPWDQKKLNRLKSALPFEQNEEEEQL